MSSSSSSSSPSSSSASGAGQRGRIEGRRPRPEVPAHAALPVVVEQELGGTAVRDGAVGGAQPVAQVVKVVRPLDAELGGCLAAGTAVVVREHFAAEQLRPRDADEGDEQHEQN